MGTVRDRPRENTPTLQTVDRLAADKVPGASGVLPPTARHDETP